MTEAPPRETLPSTRGDLRAFLADRRTRIAIGVLVVALGSGIGAVSLIGEVRGLALARASADPSVGAGTLKFDQTLDPSLAAEATGRAFLPEADTGFRAALFDADTKPVWETRSRDVPTSTLDPKPAPLTTLTPDIPGKTVVTSTTRFATGLAEAVSLPLPTVTLGSNGSGTLRLDGGLFTPAGQTGVGASLTATANPVAGALPSIATGANAAAAGSNAASTFGGSILGGTGLDGTSLGAASVGATALGGSGLAGTALGGAAAVGGGAVGSAVSAVGGAVSKGR